MDLLDITGTCEAVSVLCDELTGKLDDVKRAMDTTLLSMEQSVDHAAQKASQIEKFPLEELISKVDDAVRNLAVSEYSSQSHAEVMKELKLAHKKLELQCTDIKNDVTEIKERCGVTCGKENKHKPVDLTNLQETSNKILEEVTCLPARIKANSNWDRLEATTSYATITKSKTNSQQRKSSQAAVGNQVPVRRSEIKTLCDESKTIAIDNIVYFEQFVKKSYDTKKEFNKHFPRIKIVQCKRTKHGSLLIELEDTKTANEIVAKWKSSFFSADSGTQNKTTATLLQNKNIRGVICDVNIVMTESMIKEQFEEQFGWTNIRIRRFIDRNGIVRPTVLAHFNNPAQLDKAKKKGIFLDNVYCEIRVFEPKASVTQCYKCYGFDHTAVWCPKNMPPLFPVSQAF